MARTYPHALNEKEVKSKAEVKVFDALSEQLPDEWEVFHSVSWMIRDPAEGAQDGEMDFVLCHPDEGIITLEVKGGGLDCQYGSWFRLVDGKRESMKDPFTQALDHRYDLERKLREINALKQHNLFIGHAVCFPDITVHELVLAPDAPAEIVIDRHGVGEMSESIERALAYHRGARDRRDLPGTDGADALRRHLAKDIRIEVPMAAEFLDEEAALVTLTQQQAALLHPLAKARRIAIRGCAGSGKTMLAVERARRLAADGRKVLFICFNRALRDHLKRKEEGSGIDFFTFHSLCVRWAKVAEIELSQYPEDETPQTFWDEELPFALIEAMETIGPQYDALFVDEAQDLHNDWLDALMTTLRDPEDAHVWLFLDDNQRVYEQQLDVPKEFTPFELDVNCRNTRAIHREVIKKYKGEIEPRVIGPPGREVELFRTDDQVETVHRLIDRLCGKEEVPPQDVVVLSSHNIDKSEVAASKPGKYEFVKNPKPVGPYIRFSSIRGFKGLESPAVILCELEDLDDQTIDQQLYVGMSRARSHCLVVVPA